MLYRHLALLAVLGTANSFPQSIHAASSADYFRRDELVDIYRRQGLDELGQALTRRSLPADIEGRGVDSGYNLFRRSTDEFLDANTLLFARAALGFRPPVPDKPESLRGNSITPGSSTSRTPEAPPTTGSSPGRPPPSENGTPPPPPGPPPPIPGGKPPTPGTAGTPAPPSQPPSPGGSPPPIPGGKPPAPGTAGTPAPPSRPPPPVPGSAPGGPPAAPGVGSGSPPGLPPTGSPATGSSGPPPSAAPGSTDWTKKVQDDAKANDNKWYNQLGNKLGMGTTSSATKDAANPVPNLQNTASQQAQKITGYTRETSDATDIANNKAKIKNQKEEDINKMNANSLTNYNNNMKYFNTGKDVVSTGIAGTIASHTLGLFRREMMKRELIDREITKREAYAWYLSLDEDDFYY